MQDFTALGGQNAADESTHFGSLMIDAPLILFLELGTSFISSCERVAHDSLRAYGDSVFGHAFPSSSENMSALNRSPFGEDFCSCLLGLFLTSSQIRER